jgi:hypothetical protein
MSLVRAVEAMKSSWHVQAQAPAHVPYALSFTEKLVRILWIFSSSPAKLPQQWWWRKKHMIW